MKIKVVGLGTDAGDITLAAHETIKNADYVLVKTAKSATFEYFTQNGIDARNCDGIYNSAQDFDELNKLVAERVITRAKNHKNFVFCVNGSGNDDTAVQYLANMPDVEVEIIPGVSNTAAILRRFPLSVYLAMTSAEVSILKSIDNNIPLIVTEIYSNDEASNVKLKLMEFIDGDTDVWAFIGGEYVKTQLCELDRLSGYDYRTALYVPVVALTARKRYGYVDLVEILRILRGENGCSWDKAQTHLSIRRNNIEEAYELCDAITKGDIDGIIEETGDLIMQAAFHIEIAREEDEFDYADVFTRLCTKLISRHTHIFGEDKALTPDEVLKIWEKNKDIEKKVKTTTQSLMDVPASMTALMRAVKVQHRAAKVGFEWKDVSGAVEKTFEEIHEVLNAMKSGNKVALEEEIGDLIFSLCNVCRYIDVDPEVALSGTTEKFIKRFSYIETEIAKQGKTLKESTLEEMDALWDKAKLLDKK